MKRLRFDSLDEMKLVLHESYQLDLEISKETRSYMWVKLTSTENEEVYVCKVLGNSTVGYIFDFRNMR